MTDVMIVIDDKAADIDDLHIVNGDFGVGESALQHQRHLLLSEKGDYKENATIGVGLFGYLIDDNSSAMLRAVVQEFSRDGMLVQRVYFDDSGKIKIDANY